MIWQLADHLIEIMQDRLIELYAIAERKKNVLDEKAKQMSEESKNTVATPTAVVEQQQESTNIKPQTNVRTGGGIVTNKKIPPKNEPEVINEGIVGKGITNSSKRPSTSSNPPNSSNIEKNTPVSRPSTTSSNTKSEQNKQKYLPPRRLPAWAAKGLNSGSNEATSSSSSSQYQTPQNHPNSKWANRAANQDLQILGKPLVNKDKHKLTLELTSGEESTWNPNQFPSSKTTDRLASTLEEFDDVLLMEDPNNLHDELDTSDDEVIAGVDDGGDDDLVEENRLNMTSSKLDELEESAEKLESWLEKKVRLSNNNFSFNDFIFISSEKNLKLIQLPLMIFHLLKLIHHQNLY